MRTRSFLACLIAVVSAGCAARTAVPPIPPSATAPPIPTSTAQPPAALATPPNPTASPQISCVDWPSWPVVPAVPEAARGLYSRGQLRGNDPRAFSKIGDGEISAEWFLAAFDLGPAYYNLGPYRDLAPAIEHFRGSFGRNGTAARRGFNTQKVLDPALSDPSVCEPGESPLTCELRLHRPAFAILSLGTNQVWEPDEFEAGMRQILDILLAENVVPILSTKGDNLEGDYRINRTIACLAQEYEVPLWNFWSAIQPLPEHGLQPDREHLTYGPPDFGDAGALQTAWTIRNLTALQALDAVWRAVSTPR